MRLTPSSSSASAVGFSVAGDHAQGAAADAVIDSAATRFCP